MCQVDEDYHDALEHAGVPRYVIFTAREGFLVINYMLELVLASLNLEVNHYIKVNPTLCISGYHFTFESSGSVSRMLSAVLKCYMSSRYQRSTTSYAVQFVKLLFAILGYMNNMTWFERAIQVCLVIFH